MKFIIVVKVYLDSSLSDNINYNYSTIRNHLNFEYNQKNGEICISANAINAKIMKTLLNFISIVSLVPIRSNS